VAAHPAPCRNVDKRAGVIGDDPQPVTSLERLHRTGDEPDQPSTALGAGVENRGKIC
jgi:hypothetical protein